MSCRNEATIASRRASRSSLSFRHFARPQLVHSPLRHKLQKRSEITKMLPGERAKQHGTSFLLATSMRNAFDAPRSRVFVQQQRHLAVLREAEDLPRLLSQFMRTTVFRHAFLYLLHLSTTPRRAGAPDSSPLLRLILLHYNP